MTALPEIPSTARYGNCFGCSPNNHRGIHMTFEHAPGRVSASVTLGADFESFPGMVHGGIIATILDEVMAQAALRQGRCPATTAGMRIRYAQVMETNSRYVVIAEAGERTGDLIRVSSRLETSGGQLVAAADGTFLLWTEARAATAPLTLPPPALQSLKQFFKDIEVTP